VDRARMHPNHDFNPCESPLKKLIPNVCVHLKRKENYPSEIPKHTPLNWFIRTQTPFTNKLILPQIIAIRDEQRTKRFIHRSQAEQLHLGCLICPASGDTSLSSTSYRRKLYKFAWLVCMEWPRWKNIVAQNELQSLESYWCFWCGDLVTVSWDCWEEKSI